MEFLKREKKHVCYYLKNFQAFKVRQTSIKRTHILGTVPNKPRAMTSLTGKEELLQLLINFNDYSYIGKIINSEDVWFDRLEQELTWLDETGQIDFELDEMTEAAKERYPMVFKCSKYTYQYLDALYIVLIEGILRDYLLQTITADFLQTQDKLNSLKENITHLKRPITEKEKEKLFYWKKILISKKLDFHIIERLIDLFETKFVDIVKVNQEDDVLLERLVELRAKRISMINKVGKELQNQRAAALDKNNEPQS